MQFSEMQTEVFRRLEESSASPVYWTLAQIKESLNKGYREISDATEFYEVTDTVALTANTTYYDLSSALDPTILSVRACYNDQLDIWMRPTTVREKDRDYARWIDARGEPEEWFIRGLWWLGVFPTVSSTAGTVTVYYSALPADLSANGDTPAFPQEFHLGLVDFAVYDLLCQDRENEKARMFYGRYKGREEGLRRYVQQRQSLDRVGVMRG